MKHQLSFRAFLAVISLLLIFFILRGFQFTQSTTSFLSKHFWETIF